MRKDGSPLPEVGWGQRIALNVMPPLQATFSGEITTAKVLHLGAARFKGAVKDVWISVAKSGQDIDGDELSINCDVRLNGTTVLSTLPEIAHVTGEASMQKSTISSTDTGITKAVLDYTNYTFDAGDVFDATFVVTRTTPAVEIANPTVVVELEPT